MRNLKMLIQGLLVLFFLTGCTCNISLVNGTDNDAEVEAPVKKNIPVTATLPVLP